MKKEIRFAFVGDDAYLCLSVTNSLIHEPGVTFSKASVEVLIESKEWDVVIVKARQ